MQKSVFALIDANNFYCSCEQLFEAKLRGKPVIVLSNNDGCVVARSNEAKKIGVLMGQPVFECRELIEQHNITVFSSNYALYADLSDRLVTLLQTFSDRVELYSIDEAWLDLSHVPPDELLDYGHTIRSAIFKNIGIVVSVGIATTKTLSKISNEAAKKLPEFEGVVNLVSASQEELDALLERIAVNDVWGIGPRTMRRLAEQGIMTAKDLKYTDTRWLRQQRGVVGVRTVLELRGISCIPLELVARPKKGIMSSKTFGRAVKCLEELEEAVSTYTVRAAEKLREQGSVAGQISVFIHTNGFNTYVPQYAPSGSRSILIPTNFTPELIRLALGILHDIYRPNFLYIKAGVFLSKIRPDHLFQADLFGEFSFSREHKQARLMAALDTINRWYGPNTLFFGAQGIERRWKMRQERRSPRYTTNWRELLRVE